ncbi:MAG: hypothetical protein QME90_03615 [Thermodesulfobacteriota bacterium]|nr:hypothetical protein [Thermodesulfobacteriota bacterium]
MLEKKIQPATMTQNLVVAKYRDGRMIKGVTYNFGAEKKAFHVFPLTEGKEEEGVKRGTEVVISELKAIFFVKSLEGRKGPRTLEGLLEEEEEEGQTAAMKVRVAFHDGETLIGMTHGYSRIREGFFVLPLEKDSNNLRIFVIFNAVKEIEPLK